MRILRNLTAVALLVPMVVLIPLFLALNWAICSLCTIANACMGKSS
jgi:hypothetical protein